MSSAQLTLIGKPGCHLCDEARDVVDGVIASLVAEPAAPVIALDELSILDDAELHDKYWEQIPVLLVNGEVLDTWHVNAARLRATLLEAK